VGLVYASAHPQVDDVLVEHDAQQYKLSLISGNLLHAGVDAIHRDGADRVKRP